MRTLPWRSSIALAISLALVACGPSGTGTTAVSPAAATQAAATAAPATPAPSGGTVSVRLLGDYTNFDPQGGRTFNDQGAITGVYDRLVMFDKNNKVVPYLAKSWKSTATQIDFTVRDDAMCADGTKVTASVIAKSFQRLIDKKTVAPNLMGPGPYTVSADDASGTFTLKLGTPWSDAIYNLTHPNASVLCPAALTGTTAETTPAGSGAYTLVSATHGDGYVLQKRSGWKWGPDGLNANSPGMPDRIEFKVIANNTTAANLLQTGGLDFANISGADIQRLKDNKSLTTVISVGSYAYPLVFNEEAGHVTQNDAVRLALMTAIDPAEYIKAAFNGNAHPSPSVIAPATPCHDASVSKYLPQPSTTQARTILQGAGYTLVNGKLQKDGAPLTLKLASTSSTFASGPEYLLSRWNEVGITVTYSDVDYSTFSLSLRDGNFDVGTFNVAGSNPATGSLIGYMTGPTVAQGGTNYAHNVDPTLVQLIQKAEAATGDDACKAWADVQARILTQHHMLPLGTSELYWFGRGVDMYPSPFINTITLRRT